jgi:hypothetical protein
MKVAGFLARFLLAASFAAVVWAQSTAQINGTVTDASGAAVTGADVKATQTATGTTRTTSSGNAGEFVLPNLETGPWTIEVSKQGFSKFVQTGIVLAVADNPNIPVALQVGQATQQVEVTANAAMVETSNSGVSQVMENSAILDLPLNGRNPADLIQLTGAAVSLGSAGNASSRSMGGVLGGEGYSIAGGQTSGVTYLLDGAMHNNAYDNLNMPLPFPDALQEFKLETSALTAQSGIHAGGTINAVTRSGTNTIHGDAFEFLRNTVLDATNPFAAINPSTGKRLGDGLKRNQFGGTMGGPIIKNKIFYFAGAEGTTTRQQPASVAEFVPTAQELAGDFSTVASNVCQTSNKTLGAPFTNLNGKPNQLPVSLFSPAALKITAKLPVSTDPNCGKIIFVSPVIQNEYQVVSKLDYHLNDKHTIFLRYIPTSQHQTPPYAAVPNVLVTTTGGRDNLAQSAAIGDTYLIGSDMVNSFHIAFNRTAIHRTDKPFFDTTDVGINSFSYQPGVFLMSVTGGFSIGGGTESESTFNTDTYQIGDDFSVIKGKHQLAFGFEEAHWVSSSQANVRSPGVWTFDGSQTGLGLADFLSGKPQLLDDSEPNTLFMAQWYTGMYAQDAWKVSPRLTINLGLRYEPWSPQSINNGAVYNFSMARFLSNTVSQVYPTAPAGLYFPGDPGFLGKSGQSGHYKDFEPRIGLAWDPFGNGKMSIRASYGLFYDFANGQFFINTTIAPPFGDEIKLTTPPSFDNPWANYPGGDPFPVSTSGKNALFPLAAPYLAPTPNMPATELHSWNLSVQRQLGANWLVSANYVGNETEHLWASTSLNPGVYIPGNCTAGQYGLTAAGPCSPTNNSNLQARRVLSIANPAIGQYYGLVDQFDPYGTQSYNGLILQAQHRLSHGFTVVANDTWSHCIGDYSQEFTTPNPGTGYQFPNNRRADHGNCIFDRRNNLNATVTYATPRFTNFAVRTLASGWTMSLIYRFTAGAPLTVTTGTDRALNGNTSTQRANQVLTNTTGSGFLNFLNPTAFAEPAFGTYGNMGTYAVHGPGVPEMDFSVFRTFPLKERFNLQFRGEAFNLPNDFLRNNPVTSLSSNTFGQITSAGNPRILQFSMKVLF